MRRALIIIAVLTFATALTLAIATIADNPDPSAASKFDPQLRIDTGGITARLAVSPNRALAVSVHAGSVVRFIDLNSATCSVITGDIALAASRFPRTGVFLPWEESLVRTLCLSNGT